MNLSETNEERLKKYMRNISIDPKAFDAVEYYSYRNLDNDNMKTPFSFVTTLTGNEKFDTGFYMMIVKISTTKGSETYECTVGDFDEEVDVAFATGNDPDNNHKDTILYSKHMVNNVPYYIVMVENRLVPYARNTIKIVVKNRSIKCQIVGVVTA